MTLTVLMICSVGVSGCGNYLGDINVKGRAGFSVSESGDLIVRVQPCGLPIDTVDMAGPMPQDLPPQANPLYLELSDPDGRTDPFIVDPRNLESSWTVVAGEGLPTDPDALIIVNANVEGESTQTSQVSAYIRDIQGLSSDQIYVGNLESSRIIDESEFLHCRK
ncbi:hypothetical protein N24_0721 [Corynebacterium suranareeae]|uniref:Uncharacterized protein n=2 Tax=Corynebacterium suranareeae TaxID=2506452 RepID=A0A160PPW4_9CORY|nr:hypothetical protein N24_0721 [Corynebacterium suranareeae]